MFTSAGVQAAGGLDPETVQLSCANKAKVPGIDLCQYLEAAYFQSYRLLAFLFHTEEVLCPFYMSPLQSTSFSHSRDDVCTSGLGLI